MAAIFGTILAIVFVVIADMILFTMNTARLRTQKSQKQDSASNVAKNEHPQSAKFVGLVVVNFAR